MNVVEKISIDAEDWAERCAQDGEFQLAARHWQGGLNLKIDGDTVGIRLSEGTVSAGVDPLDGVIEYAGASAVWSELLAQQPARFHNDLMANISTASGLSVSGDPVIHAQYYSAIMRAVELLRPTFEQPELRAGDVASRKRAPVSTGASAAFDERRTCIGLTFATGRMRSRIDSFRRAHEAELASRMGVSWTAIFSQRTPPPR